MTQIAALLGNPLGHSLSPRLHNAAFAHLGIDARYELWQTPADELAAKVATLREPYMLGANVTLPYKMAVLSLIDRFDPLVELVGAANTIIRETDGSLTGANTDVPAFLAALREDAQYEPAGQAAVVLGASGAGRAAVAALLEAGASRIIVVNRTLERAEELLADALAFARDEPELYALTPDDPELVDHLVHASLIVNATSLGWRPQETPLEARLIPPSALVYDMVYRHTQLLQDATARGARTHDGLTMLVRQAALAFERWTGQIPPLDVMLTAAHS
jgi:shikimate dehydrogenase